MRLIVAGGRDWNNVDATYDFLDSLPRPSEVVSGGCTGADKIGEMWADERGIPVKRFPADWSRGRRAGPERNSAMAEYADALALLPGGRGSADMYRKAVDGGLDVWTYTNEAEVSE